MDGKRKGGWMDGRRKREEKVVVIRCKRQLDRDKGRMAGWEKEGRREGN